MSFDPNSFSAEDLKEYENLPALRPPPGVVPNFEAPNKRAEVYNILCSFLLAIVYVCVCLRLYAKVWIKRSPGFDDGKAPVFLFQRLLD